MHIKAEGNWEKELFVESSSFVASALAGAGTIYLGTTAVMFVTVATPVDWVGLIVVAATTSIVANVIMKDKSGSWYDDIMGWIKSL